MKKIPGFCLSIKTNGPEMERIGISASRSSRDTAVKILLGMGVENLTFLIEKEKAESRWSVQIRVQSAKDFQKIYFFEKQRGGARLFNHLDDAISFAIQKAPTIKRFEIVFSDKLTMKAILEEY